MNKKEVKLVEIGPRDGFQNVKEFIPTDVKLNVLKGLVSAGYKKIQITSFVSEKAIPQMKDAREITDYMLENHSDLDLFALVPNYYGAKSAWETGLREITPVMSLSETHNQANVRRSHDESINELKKIRDDFPEMKITQDIATVFGCPYEGKMEVGPLLELIGRMGEIGIDAITLCDTIGVAYPAQVEEVLDCVYKNFPDYEFNFHVHDTRNMGILNSYISIQKGINSVQTSIGGLGGCPFAPGATGNTASEDLIYLLEHDGYDTGIDFSKVLETAKYMKENINGNFSGHHINISVVQHGFN